MRRAVGGSVDPLRSVVLVVANLPDVGIADADREVGVAEVGGSVAGMVTNHAGGVGVKIASILTGVAPIAGFVADDAVAAEVPSELTTRQFVAGSVANATDATGLLGVVEAGACSIAGVVANHANATVLPPKGAGGAAAARIVADDEAARRTTSDEQAGIGPCVAGAVADVAAAAKGSHAIADSKRFAEAIFGGSVAGVVADVAGTFRAGEVAGKVTVTGSIADDSTATEFSKSGARRVTVA